VPWYVFVQSVWIESLISFILCEWYFMIALRVLNQRHPSRSGESFHARIERLCILFEVLVCQFRVLANILIS
jgi:hypothetical protein